MAIGLLLLVAGVGLTVWRAPRALNAPDAEAEKTAAIRRQIDSLEKLVGQAPVNPNAKPAFQVTFVEATLDEYRKLVRGDSEGAAVVSVDTPRVVKTDVASRLADSSAITPDYANARTKDVFLREFIPIARRHHTRLRVTFVYALLIRQSGVGRADSVVMDADRSEIDGVVEIYEPSDLTGSGDVKSKLHRHAASLSRTAVDIGTMDTGQGAIVPLLIANFFWRTDGGNDPSGWIVADGVGYIPTRLRFTRDDGTRDSLSLSRVLAKPMSLGVIPE